MADIGEEPGLCLVEILEFTVVSRQFLLLSHYLLPQTELGESKPVIEIEADAYKSCRDEQKKERNRNVLDAAFRSESDSQIADDAEQGVDQSIDTPPSQEQNRTNHNQIEPRVVRRAAPSGFHQHSVDCHHRDQRNKMAKEVKDPTRPAANPIEKK